MSRSWRPSPAGAIALIALVVALAGTASALPGKNSVKSNDIKAGHVRGSDIAPGALAADEPTPVAPNPKGASDPCEGGATTGVFCGSTADGYFLNFGGAFTNVSFAKDPSGRVHLAGTVGATNPGVNPRVFVLPPGYRPAATVTFGAPCSVTNVNDYAPCPLFIDADGIVYYTPGGDGSPWEGMSFDGISFPAA